MGLFQVNGAQMGAVDRMAGLFHTLSCSEALGAFADDVRPRLGGRMRPDQATFGHLSLAGGCPIFFCRAQTMITLCKGVARRLQCHCRRVRGQVCERRGLIFRAKSPGQCDGGGKMGRGCRHGAFFGRGCLCRTGGGKAGAPGGVVRQPGTTGRTVERYAPGTLWRECVAAMQTDARAGQFIQCFGWDRYAVPFPFDGDGPCRNPSAQRVRASPGLCGGLFNGQAFGDDTFHGPHDAPFASRRQV